MAARARYWSEDTSYCSRQAGVRAFGRSGVQARRGEARQARLSMHRHFFGRGPCYN